MPAAFLLRSQIIAAHSVAIIGKLSWGLAPPLGTEDSVKWYDSSSGRGQSGKFKTVAAVVIQPEAYCSSGDQNHHSLTAAIRYSEENEEPVSRKREPHPSESRIQKAEDKSNIRDKKKRIYKNPLQAAKDMGVRAKFANTHVVLQRSHMKECYDDQVIR